MNLSFAPFFLINLSFSSAQAEEINIPDPVFVHSRATKEQERMTIERMAGCYGNVDEARKTIHAPNGIVQEPIFQSNTYTKGVFDMTAPGCILEDDPQGLHSFDMRTMNFEDYLFQEFSCGCGECYIGDENSFGEDEVLAHATEIHRKEYAKYKKRQDKKVADAKIVYAKYKAEYARWSDVRKKNLRNKSIRITVIPDKDMAEGTLTVFHYLWHVRSWCGDPHQVDRLDVRSKAFPHPAVKKGEELNVWLDNANIDISWGVVWHDTETSSQEIMDRIKSEAQHRYQEELRPLNGLSEMHKGRVIETQPGRAADIIDECCAC